MSGRRSLMIANGGTQERPIEGQTGVWLYSSGVVISSGWRMTVSSGVRWTSQAVCSGGVATTYMGSNNNAPGYALRVRSGGIVSSSTQDCHNAYGITVQASGLAIDTVVSNGIFQVNGYPVAGSAINTIQYGGIGFVANYGYVSGYVLSGGNFSAFAGGGKKELYDFVEYGGVCSLGTNCSAFSPVLHGGTMHVINGGRVFSTSVLGGEVRVSSGGRVWDMAIISSGSATVSPGAEIYGLTMSGVGANTAKLYVSGGGVVTSASVTFGGYLVPRNAGIVSGVTVNSGGLLYPVFGGSAVDVVIERGGHASAGVSGGWMSGVTVESGGYLTVSSGGTALAVTSRAGANVQVIDGGYIEYVTP